MMAVYSVSTFYAFYKVIESVIRFLGGGPLLPTVYGADTMGPTLTRWYFNRDTFDAIILYFNEPVTANLSALVNNPMAVTTTLILSTGGVEVPLQSLTISYASFQTQLSFQFNTSTFDFTSLFNSAANLVYLNITQNVFFDLALPSNGNAAIIAFEEGSPGTVFP